MDLETANALTDIDNGRYHFCPLIKAKCNHECMCFQFAETYEGRGQGYYYSRKQGCTNKTINRPAPKW